MYRYIVVLCILILIFITVLKQNKKEHYQEENHLNVMLTKSIYDTKKITLGGDKTDLNDEATSKLMKKIFPFQLNNVNYENLLKTQSDLLILPQIYNKIISTSNEKYSFVCSLYTVCLTLILPINTEVKNKNDFETLKIGTFNKNHASNLFLKLFSNIMNLKLNIVHCDTYGDLFTKWKSGEIDSIFLLISHPNQFVKLFSYQEEIKLFNWDILFKDINLKRIFIFHMPYLIKVTIPIANYRFFKLSNYYTGYGFNVNMLSSNKIDDGYIYNILKTIYINYAKIKNNCLWMYQLSPSWMSNCPPDMVFHPDAKKFYIDINLISEQYNDCYMLNLECNRKTRNILYGIIDKRLGIL